jgi:hypothetical protein
MLWLPNAEAAAAMARLVKVLPHFIDREGGWRLAPASMSVTLTSIS